MFRNHDFQAAIMYSAWSASATPRHARPLLSGSSTPPNHRHMSEQHRSPIVEIFGKRKGIRIPCFRTWGKPLLAYSGRITTLSCYRSIHMSFLRSISLCEIEIFPPAFVLGWVFIVQLSLIEIKWFAKSIPVRLDNIFVLSGRSGYHVANI